jgi:hypothetical protein
MGAVTTVTVPTVEYVGWLRSADGRWVPVAESGSMAVAWDLVLSDLSTRPGHVDATVLVKGTHPDHRPAAPGGQRR